VSPVDHHPGPWRARAARYLALPAVLLVLLPACTGQTPPEQEQPPPATGAPAADRCGDQGAGTLEVTVTGLAAGQEATVTVTGAGVSVGGTGTVSAGEPALSLGLNSGEYDVVSEVVVGPDHPVAREAYGAGAAAVCVRDGQVETVTLAYHIVPTSHLLWVGNDIGGNADLVAFAAGDLAASGRPTVEASADTRGKAILAFDRAGNLWLAGRTIDDPPLLRYPAAAVAGGGGREVHDIGITSAVFGDSPTVEALAFDPAGNLWTAVQHGPVVMFTAEQLARSGSPTPTVEIGGLVRTRALAFDAAGNLWASSDRAVVRYDASRLATSTHQPPDLALELMSPPPVVGSLPTIWGMAFDVDGNLWVNHQGTLFARVTPADQAGSGARTITPDVQINIAITGLAQGIAFDDSGGLWFVYDPGRVARLAADQLTTSAGPGARAVPETIIDSAELGQAGSVAFYPASAGLPLHHSLP
jgi:hypothetical protein